MCDSCVRAITHTRYGSRVGRVRIDSLLAERGLFETRSKAAASIVAGEVRVGPGRRRAAKPGELVEEGVLLAVDDRPRFVSRGGQKLANALDNLGIDVSGRLCLDVGASTGGFTDCLLQRGAARVIAVDVAYGELAWSVRNDARVDVLERQNARHLEPELLAYRPDLVTVDVSFISITKLLPALVDCMAPRCELLALVKPQFEAGKGRVGKGGVVRSAGLRREVLLSAARAAGAVGLHVRGFAASGLPGPKGNIETFMWCDREGPPVADLEHAVREVEP
jgi:23S rRNA (cytidine1920-2'-O)/16S rRNA (cytidine1409-2'-O)-methyltransferase